MPRMNRPGKILCHKLRPWIFTKGLTKWCRAESEGQSVLCRMWKFTVEELQNLWLVWSQRKSTMQALIHLVLGDLSAKAMGGSQTLREAPLTRVSQDSSNTTTRSEQTCHRTQGFPELQSCPCVDLRSACSPAPPAQLVTLSPPFLPFLGLSYNPPSPFCGGSSFLSWATGIVSQRSL